MDLKVPRKLVDVTKISISTENRISNSVYCQNSSWPIRRLRKGLTTFDRRNKACVFRQLVFFWICHFHHIFWNSDYRQRFPLESTRIWRSRIHRLCALSFHLQFQVLSTPPVDGHANKLMIQNYCLQYFKSSPPRKLLFFSFFPSLFLVLNPHGWRANSLRNFLFLFLVWNLHS